MDILKSLPAAMLLVSAVVALSTCSEPEEPKPEITQISPSLGQVGTEAKIAGKNLATVEEIKFGTVAAGVITKSATEILTVAPAALVPGDVSVTVKSKGGVSNAISFKVIPSDPEVTLDTAKWKLSA